MDVKSFEKGMAEIEDIAAELEAGDLPLEKAVERFSRGMAALARCREMLAKAEERVRLLTRCERGGDPAPARRERRRPGAPEAGAGSLPGVVADL